METHSSLTETQLGTRPGWQIQDAIYCLPSGYHSIQHNTEKLRNIRRLLWLLDTTAFPSIYQGKSISLLCKENIAGRRPCTGVTTFWITTTLIQLHISRLFPMVYRKSSPWITMPSSGSWSLSASISWKRPWAQDILRKEGIKAKREVTRRQYESETWVGPMHAWHDGQEEVYAEIYKCSRLLARVYKTACWAGYRHVQVINI